MNFLWLNCTQQVWLPGINILREKPLVRWENTHHLMHTLYITLIITAEGHTYSKGACEMQNFWD